jgi:hypothetical protein
MQGFLTVSSDISAHGGFRPDDPDATTDMPTDIAAQLDFQRSSEWRSYYERNATFPVSAVLFHCTSDSLTVRVSRRGEGRRITMRVPAAFMREAIKTASCRDVYHQLIYRIWETAAERFDWNEELPPMPPISAPSQKSEHDVASSFENMRIAGGLDMGPRPHMHGP